MPVAILNGVRAYYEESGDGEPVCLIHGFSASSYSWRKIIPILSKSFQVYALDLKGFGMSEKPGGDNYSIWSLASWVKQFFDEVGITSTSIVGHSLGGRIGLLLAASCHERIKNLILINPAAYKPDNQAFFVRLARSHLVTEFMMRGRLARYFVRKGLKKAYYNDELITEEVVDNYIKPLLDCEGRRGLTYVARALQKEDIQATILNYRKIKCPVLLIWGENDEVLERKMFNRLRKEIEGNENKPILQSHLISECGHIPQEEKPEDVCALTTEFIWKTLPV
ncbi:MAG: alpha/beta fold hydrolase [Thermodesulfobacteriota bacterium]